MTSCTARPRSCSRALNYALGEIFLFATRLVNKKIVGATTWKSKRRDACMRVYTYTACASIQGVPDSLDALSSRLFPRRWWELIECEISKTIFLKSINYTHTSLSWNSHGTGVDAKPIRETFSKEHPVILHHPVYIYVYEWKSDRSERV